MYIILTLIALPIAIKILTNYLIFKLKSIPKNSSTAESIIEDMRRKEIRSLKVEQKYIATRYNFNQALKNKEIDRTRILAIKTYLQKHTEKWEYNKEFKNDAHMIYHLMKSKSLKVRDFDMIDKLIGVRYK